MQIETTDERIERLESWIVPVPLRRAHVMSFGSIGEASLVLTRVTSTGGATGWGETTILGGPFWNEETCESVHATLTRYVFPQLVGVGVHDHGSIDAVVNTVRRNHFAKSALDIALHDLRARLAGVSVAQHLAGRTDTSLPVSWSLANGDTEADLDELAEKLEAGHRIFKVKMGSQPLEADLDRLSAIRARAGSGVSLRVDANQGWTRAEAARAVAALADLDLDFVEQPLMKGDLEGMRELQRSTSISIAADESLETLDEAGRLLAMHAARVFVYKIAKHGGYRESLRIAELGRSQGIEGYLGCMIESSIGTAACIALAAAAPRLTHGCELFGPLLLAEDLVEVPVTVEQGRVSLPSGPGLGVTVDTEKVAHLCQRHDVVHL